MCGWDFIVLNEKSEIITTFAFIKNKKQETI